MASKERATGAAGFEGWDAVDIVVLDGGVSRNRVLMMMTSMGPGPSRRDANQESVNQSAVIRCVQENVVDTSVLTPVGSIRINT
jgi:hypothetical protein